MGLLNKSSASSGAKIAGVHSSMGGALISGEQQNFMRTNSQNLRHTTEGGGSTNNRMRQLQDSIQDDNPFGSVRGCMSEQRL